MSRLVVDCSLTMCWCFPDEASDYAESVLKSIYEFGAIVPQLWSWEVANALLVGERRRRVTRDDVHLFVEILNRMPLVVDVNPPQRVLDGTLNLARAYQLTAYDAAYLELAQRESLTLCTLDKQLIAVAPAAGVELFVAASSQA